MTKLSSDFKIKIMKAKQKDPYYKSRDNIIYEKDSIVFSYIDTINKINVNKIDYKNNDNIDDEKINIINKPIEHNPTKKWPNDVLNDNINILTEIKKLLENKINNHDSKLKDPLIKINEDLNSNGNIELNQIVNDLNSIIDNSYNNKMDVIKDDHIIVEPIVVKESINDIQSEDKNNDENSNFLQSNETTSIIRPFGNVSNSNLDDVSYLYNSNVEMKSNHDIYELSNVNRGFELINNEEPESFVLDNNSNELIHVDGIHVEDIDDDVNIDENSINFNKNEINNNLNQIVESFDEILNGDMKSSDIPDSLENLNNDSESNFADKLPDEYIDNYDNSKNEIESLDSDEDINTLQKTDKNNVDFNSSEIQSYDFSDVDDYGPLDENDNIEEIDSENEKSIEYVNKNLGDDTLSTTDDKSSDSLNVDDNLNDYSSLDDDVKNIAELDTNNDNNDKQIKDNIVNEHIDTDKNAKIADSSIASFEDNVEKVEDNKSIIKKEYDDPRKSSPLLVDVNTYKITKEELQEPKASEHTETINKQVESLKTLDSILNSIMG